MLTCQNSKVQNLAATENKKANQADKRQTIPINTEGTSQAEIEESILKTMAGATHGMAVEQVFIAAALGPLEHGTEALAVTYWAGRFGSKHRLKWKRQPAFGELVFQKCDAVSDPLNPTFAQGLSDQTEGSMRLKKETSAHLKIPWGQHRVRLFFRTFMPTSLPK